MRRIGNPRLSQIMNRDEILENKNDLIDGTFCYELFELKIFNEKLFVELIDGINKYLIEEKGNGRNPDREILNFLSWFVIGVMRCVIYHNDPNDEYSIEQFSMTSWHEEYEPNLTSVLNRAINIGV